MLKNVRSQPELTTPECRLPSRHSYCSRLGTRDRGPLENQHLTQSRRVADSDRRLRYVSRKIILSKRRIADRLDEIARHCASLPLLDHRSPEEILHDDCLRRAEQAHVARQAFLRTPLRGRPDCRTSRATRQNRVCDSLPLSRLLCAPTPNPRRSRSIKSSARHSLRS